LAIGLLPYFLVEMQHICSSRNGRESKIIADCVTRRFDATKSVQSPPDRCPASHNGPLVPPPFCAMNSTPGRPSGRRGWRLVWRHSPLPHSQPLGRTRRLSHPRSCRRSGEGLGCTGQVSAGRALPRPLCYRAIVCGPRHCQDVVVQGLMLRLYDNKAEAAVAVYELARAELRKESEGSG
jgi:hypothetical protein